MTTPYRKRIADEILRERLKSSGAVLVEGPKWCGKTRTAAEFSSSQLFMEDPEKGNAYLKTADTKPSLLLKGDTPRLLDEWQAAPVLWDAVRFMVDQRGLPGQFILTESAKHRDNAAGHTGTGRISRMTMRPMTLYESGESNGSVSLAGLFDGETEVGAFSDLSIEQIAFAIVRGGWPAAAAEGGKEPLRYGADYAEAVIREGISRADGIEKNPDRVRALLRALSRNILSSATVRALREDIAKRDGIRISEKTIRQYLKALNRIFIAEDLPAWNPALRTRSVVRTSPKRQFADPSIAAAVMGLKPESILDDFICFGFLFASLCIRDLRVYAEANDGAVFHYHDSSGLATDAVIALNDGRWAAAAITLGTKETEEAAKRLVAFKSKVNTEKMGEPSFLMVVTGSEIAYRRPDGVFVVPAGCLKP